MKTFAVIDMNSKWILSVHATRDAGEARLRAYMNGVLDRGSVAAIAPWMPPGKNDVPHLQVVEVAHDARARAYYEGAIVERRAHNLRRKSA